MRRSTALLSVVLPVLLALLCTACTARAPVQEPVHPPLPADLLVVRSVPVDTAQSANMESACLSVSDPGELGGQFRERLERTLFEHQFTLTDQPSLAERIISLKILYKGKGSEEGLRASVMAGYDAPLAHMSGDKSVLVADLLLVRRRIPAGNTALRTASMRTATSSTSVRVGIATGVSKALKDRVLEEALARDIALMAAPDKYAEEHDTTVRPQKKARTVKKSVSRTKAKKSAKSSKSSGKKKR